MNRFILPFVFLFSFLLNGQEIALLKYSGGGDWYVNPTSLPNLIAYCNENIHTTIKPKNAIVEPSSPDLFSYPYVHMTGHGNVFFSDSDVINLRNYLTSGGFLHIDDNYGMDEFIRKEIKKLFPDSILFSEINETGQHTSSKVLIVDTIGMLSKIYRYATICYVGGGFNKSGIHNIIEAAVYGKVVCFGKYFGFSREAASLIKLGAGYSFADATSFSTAVQALLGNKQELEKKNEIAKNFVALNKGATNTIMDYIERNLLLSNSIN